MVCIIEYLLHVTIMNIKLKALTFTRMIIFLEMLTIVELSSISHWWLLCFPLVSLWIGIDRGGRRVSESKESRDVPEYNWRKHHRQFSKDLCSRK